VRFFISESSLTEKKKKYRVCIMEISLEQVERCPLCGNGDSRFLADTFDRFYRLPGEFSLIECAECSLVRLSPRPTKESLGFYYPEGEYYSYQVMPADIPHISKGLKDFIRNTVLSGLGYGSAQSFFVQLIRPVIKWIFFGRATYGWGARLPRFVQGGKAIDIGCGSGKYLYLLKLLGSGQRCGDE
jgi:hypothetical protein